MAQNLPSMCLGPSTEKKAKKWQNKNMTKINIDAEIVPII